MRDRAPEELYFRFKLMLTFNAVGALDVALDESAVGIVESGEEIVVRPVERLAEDSKATVLKGVDF